jgi:orotidine-5'-phosphate decarboxylase
MADLCVALDVASEAEALELVDRLGHPAEFYKVGLELFTIAGPPVVHALRSRGKRVFLDLKLLDIPNTVAGAVAAAGHLGVDLLTVHTTGGPAMLRAAAEAAPPTLRLLGVTLLTSFPVSEVEAAWGRTLVSLRDEVLRLADLAVDCGLAGVVASPLEASAIRRRLGGVLIVTPGIRMAGGETHDQTRVATPAAAVAAGADILVVGRAVTAASDPRGALEAIRAELAGAEEGDTA